MPLRSVGEGIWKKKLPGFSPVPRAVPCREGPCGRAACAGEVTGHGSARDPAFLPLVLPLSVRRLAAACLGSLFCTDTSPAKYLTPPAAKSSARAKGRLLAASAVRKTPGACAWEHQEGTGGDAAALIPAQPGGEEVGAQPLELHGAGASPVERMSHGVWCDGSGPLYVFGAARARLERAASTPGVVCSSPASWALVRRFWLPGGDHQRGSLTCGRLGNWGHRHEESPP